MQNETLYLAQEDLYRFGNGSSPRMSNFRPGELDIIDINGIETVIANGSGISLYNKEGLDEAPLTGWVWTIKSGTTFPSGLKLIRDENPLGHHTLAPANNMPFSQYIGLLEQVASYCNKEFKKKA